MEKYFKILVLILGLTVAGVAISLIINKRLEILKSDNTTATTVVTAKERERQLACLARNIYHEAANESFEGKVAIAQVTLNRSENKNFPNDICEVVYQKNIFMQKVVCQFSWYCRHGGKPPVKYKEAYQESYEVAKKVLLEGFRLDSLKNAIYYHADYVNPNWNKPRVAKIGRHIFYKESNNEKI